MQFRQGDVFVSSSEIPKDAVRQRPVVDRHVLAEGEATGHAHVVAAAHALAYLAGLDMYLRVLRDTPITHEEHDPIVLPPGDYKIIRQREYAPEEIRRVAD